MIIMNHHNLHYFHDCDDRVQELPKLWVDDAARSSLRKIEFDAQKQSRMACNVQWPSNTWWSKMIKAQSSKMNRIISKTGKTEDLHILISLIFHLLVDRTARLLSYRDDLGAVNEDWSYADGHFKHQGVRDGTVGKGSQSC